MTTDPFKEVKDAWDWFQIQSVIIRNYNGLNFLGPRQPNPMVDRSILSLLTVTLASVLDESLEAYISCFTISGKNDKLFNRIEALRAAAKILNADQLHDVRLARNKYAHQASDSSGLGEPMDWGKLEQQITEVDECLRQLGMLDSPHRYEYFAERTPVEPPNDGAVISLKYRSGVKRDGKVAFAYEFTNNHYGLGGK